MDLVLPFTEAGTLEEAAPDTLGGAAPQFNLPKAENYAADANTIARILEEVTPVVEYTRLQRATLEEEWRAIRRMEMQVHDDGQRYFGRSRSYLPVYSRIAQTLVSTISRGLFPSDEYMDVVDRGSGDPEKAKPVKTYLQWEFERNGKVRNSLKPFLRQYVNYGNAVNKFWYKKELRTEGRNLKKLDLVKLATTEPGFQKVTVNEGLAISARSIFNWYIFPLTAEGIDDATMVFEDIDTPRAYIEKMVREKRWLNGDSALNAPAIPAHDANQADQMAGYQAAANTASPVMGKKLGDVRTITEIWTMLVLPPSAYVDGEDKGAPVSCRLVMAGNIPLEVTRNPFWHQRPPYQFSAANRQPGMVYGYGYGRMVRNLQYLVNDFVNQTNDCGIYALNPIAKVNPGMVMGPLRPLAPGVTWYLSDIHAGAVFDRPPVEVVSAGLSMVNAFMGMAQDFGGAPPILQGTNTKRAANTATGAQILQKNAMGPLQDVVEDIEHDVLIPLLYGTWVNAQQFRDKDVMAEIGGAPLNVTMAELAIDPEFRWLASSQAVNAQQRSQQLMQLAQGILPLVPLVQSQGYILDVVPLLRRIYTDGMGFRGFSDFIRKMDPMQMQAMQAAQMGGGAPPGTGPPPGGPPGAGGPPPGERIRSATEQAPGGGVGMQPGEGGEFQNVRQNGDELAALLGAGGGG